MINHDAFISYRRADGARAAKWIRRELLRYKLPKSLTQKQPQYKQRRLRIYRDIEYAYANEDFFKKNICPAIESSRFLIVVATPSCLEAESGGSPNWIELEAEAFFSTSGTERQLSDVLVVRASGSDEDPLPSAISTRLPKPHILDLRPLENNRWPRFTARDDLRTALLGLVAPIHGIRGSHMNLLRDEDNRRRRRTLYQALAGSITIIIMLMALSIYAMQQRRAAEQRLDAALDLIWNLNETLDQKAESLSAIGGIETGIKTPADLTRALNSDRAASAFALTYGNLGSWAALINWPEEAVRFFQLAAEAALRSSMSDKEIGRVLSGLSLTGRAWGDQAAIEGRRALLSGNRAAADLEFKTAETAYVFTLDIERRLSRFSATEAEDEYRTNNIKLNLANVRMHKSEPSVQGLKSAIAASVELSARFPENQLFCYQAAQALKLRAEFEERSGDLTAARQTYARSFELDSCGRDAQGNQAIYLRSRLELLMNVVRLHVSTLPAESSCPFLEPLQETLEEHLNLEPNSEYSVARSDLQHMAGYCS